MAQFPSPIYRWLTALVVASGVNLFGQPPAPNSLVIPAYPTLAKIAQVEGTVVVEIEFGPAGLIQSLKVQDHDKKLSMLSYAVVTSISKWRVVTQAGQKFTIPFVFQLLPFDCKDSEIETKLDLFTSVTIKARKSQPIESSHFQDPAPKKQWFSQPPNPPLHSDPACIVFRSLSASRFLGFAQRLGAGGAGELHSLGAWSCPYSKSPSCPSP